MMEYKHTMELHFAKLHGAGNDFVFVDDFSHEIELTEEQVAFLCDRHFGIGADGVILVRPSERPECSAYMHYINSDGSLAQMCGNGVRCFAKYLVDRGYVQAHEGRSSPTRWPDRVPSASASTNASA